MTDPNDILPDGFSEIRDMIQRLEWLNEHSRVHPIDKKRYEDGIKAIKKVCAELVELRASKPQRKSIWNIFRKK